MIPQKLPHELDIPFMSINVYSSIIYNSSNRKYSNDHRKLDAQLLLNYVK